MGKVGHFGAYGDNPDLAVAYTSYGACTGTWFAEFLAGNCYYTVLYPSPPSSCSRFRPMNNSINGVFRYSDSPRSLDHGRDEQYDHVR